MSKLAINGAKKVREKLFPAHITIGNDESIAVQKVIDSGVLSKFLGCWHDDFYGGPEVIQFEKEWAQYFNVKNAIAVNSATSGIYCAVGAIGAGPGDEIIVSPYTMSASAIAPIIYNAIPVFADIETEYFCLSPDSIEERITDRTKAIIVVDIFGMPYDADRINSIARKHGLLVIEDCAQAPGAKYKNIYAGVLGDIGIYSLNYHKHIHTGEGGVVVTNNDELAEKIRLIRNHAEAVIADKGYSTLVNMIGFNNRMTEIEASIGSVQLKKLSKFIDIRLENLNYLTMELSKIPCLDMAQIRENSSHVFYMHPIKFNQEIAGIHRNIFIDAVKAELMPHENREKEGVKISSGYVKPLYLQPLYQNKIAYGEYGCPWTCERYGKKIDYSKGICPVAEKMHEDVLIVHEMMLPSMTRNDLDDVISAFNKVWENRHELL